MYLPSPFEVRDRAVVCDLIDASPFATLITAGDALVVSHLPLTLERPAEGADESAGWGRLRGHVARGNDHWRLFDGRSASLAVFHGPHAYVSPTTYANRAAPPTWNYAVVHAWGRPRRVEAGAETHAHLDALVSRFESAPLELPDAARAALEKGVVAFELEVERVEAKFKLGQNRSPEDRAGTVAALAQGRDVERDLAAWTRRVTGVA